MRRVSKLLWTATAVIGSIGLMVVAGPIDTFDKGSLAAIYQGEEAGATVAIEDAAGANGQAAKVSWTSVPKKGIVYLFWPDGSRPAVPINDGGDAGGALKFRVFLADAKAVRRFEVRIKDAKGENWTWGNDADLKSDAWQDITITLRKGLETSRRPDKPGRDDGVLDAPFQIAHLSIVLNKDAKAGSVLIDDLNFEPAAAPATQPAVTP